LVFRLVSGPAGVLLGVNGVLSWTPNEGQGPGDYKIQVAVSDGSAQAYGELSVRVDEVNRRPSVGALPVTDLLEGQSFEIRIPVSDPDLPAQVLSLKSTPDDSQALAGSRLQVTAIGGLASITGTLAPGWIGSFSIRLEVEDGSSLLGVSDVQVRVNPRPPSILSGPISTSLQAGDTLVLGVLASGTPPLRYRWERNGQVFPGAAEQSLRLAGITTSDAGLFRVRVSGPGGEVVSEAATVEVRERIEFTEAPRDVRVAVGERIVLKAVAIASVTPTYQWFRDGIAVPGQVNAQLEIPTANLEHAGLYSVEATAGGTRLMSGRAQVEVLEPPRVVSLASNVDWVLGRPANLGVVVTGTGPFSYRWSLNGTPLATELDPQIVRAQAAEVDQGDYEVEISNRVGTARAVSRVRVVRAPVIRSWIGGGSVNEGSPSAFEVVSDGTLPIQYQWSFRGNGATEWTEIAGATGRILSLISVAEKDSGSYRVAVSNEWGSVVSDAIPLEVKLPPRVVGIVGGGEILAGGELVLTPTVTGSATLRFQWLRNGVEMTGVDTQILRIAAATAAAGGRYRLRVQNDQGAATSAEVLVSIVEPPRQVDLVASPSAPRLAEGSRWVLDANALGTGPFEFQWIRNGIRVATTSVPRLELAQLSKADSGRWEVDVSNRAGKASSSPVQIQVLTAPRIVQQALGLTNTPGAKVELVAAVEGDPEIRYQWFFNGNPLDGAMGLVLSLPSLSVDNAGLYEFTAENSVGITRSAPIPVVLDLQVVAAGNTPDSGSALPSEPSGSFSLGVTSPSPALSGRVRQAGDVSSEQALWIRWQAPSGGRVVFDTRGSDYDTVLTAYQKTAAGLIRLATDDDSAGYSLSKVLFDAVSGQEYLLEVVGFDGATGRTVINYEILQTTVGTASILSPPQGVVLRQGVAAAMTVTTGGAPGSISWTRNGVASPGATAATLEMGPASESRVGNYSAVVASGQGGESVQIRSKAAMVVLASDAIPPFADKHAEATVGLLPSTNPEGTVLLMLSGLGREIGEPVHGDPAQTASSWWRFTSPVSGHMEFKVVDAEVGVSIAVYEATQISGMKRLAGSGLTSAGGEAGCVIPVVAGRTYSLALAGDTQSGNPIRLQYRFAATPTPSVVGPSSLFSEGAEMELAVDVGSGFRITDYGIQWFRDLSPIEGATGPRLRFSNLSTADSGLYSVRISNWAGILTSQPFEVRVMTPITLSAVSGPRLISTGRPGRWSVDYSGSEPVEILWSREGSSTPIGSGSTLDLPSLSVSDGGTYVVTVRNAVSEMRQTFEVLVGSPLESVSLSGPNVVIEGSPLTLVAAVAGSPEGVQYLWYLDGVVIPDHTSARLTLPKAMGTDGGFFAVEARNPFGVVSSQPFEVRIATPLTWLKQPEPEISLLPGATLQLYVEVSGGLERRFQWYREAVPIAGATSSTLRIPGVTALDSGSFSVRVTDDQTTISSRPCRLIVQSPPVFVQVPAASGVRYLDSLSLEVRVTSDTPSQVQWVRNGVIIPGASGNRYQIESAMASDSGSYQVIASNEAGTTYSPVFQVSVDLAPRVSLTDLVVNEGAPMTFEAEVRSALPFEVSWYFGDKALDGEKATRLTRTSATPADSGTYRIEVASQGQPTVSVTARVDVNRKPAGVFGPLVAKPGDVLRIPIASLLAVVSDPEEEEIRWNGVISTDAVVAAVEGAQLVVRVEGGAQPTFRYAVQDSRGAVGVITVRIDTEIRLSILANPVSGGILLKWSNPSGRTLVPQFSSDLVHWTGLAGTPKPTAEGVELSVDSGAGPLRFFRLVESESAQLDVVLLVDPASGTMRLRWPNLSGRSFVPQVSSDLVNWSGLPGTPTPSPDGLELTVDSGSAPKRFYRVLSQTP
jgi:hypothetical protein